MIVMCCWFIWRKTKFSVRDTLMLEIVRVVDSSTPVSCCTWYSVLIVTLRFVDAFRECLRVALETFLTASWRAALAEPPNSALIEALPQPHPALTDAPTL